MRIVLSILLGLVVVLPYCGGCSASQIATMQTCGDTVPGYDIVIRFFEYGNAIDNVMDVFSRNGFMITKVQQTYLSTERQVEMRISIKAGNSKELSSVMRELREAICVFSVTIEKS